MKEKKKNPTIEGEKGVKTILYGMSGTLKLTTMDIDPDYIGAWRFPSDIKRWKEMASWIPGYTGSDLDFAFHRLLLLEYTRIIKRGDINVVLERGVTDYIESYLSRPWHTPVPEKSIIHMVGLERKALGNNSKPRKILLEMLDQDFIESKVLQDKYRREVFPDLPTYLERQNKYIEFTKKYNPGIVEVKIESAEDYIKELKKKRQRYESAAK
jgi:hypothetical protein